MLRLAALLLLWASIGAAQTDPERIPEPPRGRLRFPTELIQVTGAGDLDAAVLVRMVQARRPALLRCYERALTTSSALAGRVQVMLTVEESGRVYSVSVVSSTVESDAVSDCIVRVVRGFRFSPGPVGGSATFVLPLEFSPAP